MNNANIIINDRYVDKVRKERALRFIQIMTQAIKLNSTVWHDNMIDFGKNWPTGINTMA